MKHHRKTGSGLFVVLIIAASLGIGIYSVLALVQGEFLRNKKSAVFHEAKQAAESVLQQSIADLKRRFDRQTAFPVDSLSPSRNPLHLSPEFVDIHTADGADSSLLIPSKTKYTSVSDFGSEPTEVIGGQIPPGQWRYIDPRVPGNQFDELAGTRVFERNIEMVAKATVSRPNLGRQTVHVRQFLQVRDAPLFAYAIFYNMPMEIAPGPRMEVHGNVHSNKDSWFQANTGLDIYAKVTVAGDMNHGRHPDSGKSDSFAEVRMPDADGDLVNMKKDGSWPADTGDGFSGWLESSVPDFFDISNQLWDGNVQTGAHGVLPQTPVGVTEYVEDTDPSTDRKESFNSAYPLIQPVLDAGDLAIPDENAHPAAHQEATALNEIEKQKYAYKAGLTIQVETDGSLSYHTFERDAEGNLTYDGSGRPITRELVPGEPVAESEIFFEEDGDILAGMHDKRQARDLNLVEVDVGKLKDLVHANDESAWGGEGPQRPDRWWNGVVYVDFPQQASGSTRDDHVNPAIPGWGVKLKNGSVIPNPSFAHSKDIYGMSVATNQMMYVEGDYNADGDRDTGSPVQPDDPENFAREGHEAPAALIADSLTFLSKNWDDARSTDNLAHREAVDTEVSAAVLAGIVPSGEDGSDRYSGGVENFPRFLEDWNNESLRIRGSLAALYESEVGTRGWGYGDVYNAPNRDWGFHEKFAEGFLPPGTPNTRRYRAVDFEVINEASYENHVARIKTYF